MAVPALQPLRQPDRQSHKPLRAGLPAVEPSNALPSLSPGLRPCRQRTTASGGAAGASGATEAMEIDPRIPKPVNLYAIALRRLGVSVSAANMAASDMAVSLGMMDPSDRETICEPSGDDRPSTAGQGAETAQEEARDA